MKRKDYKELDFENALEKVSHTLDLKKSGELTRSGLGKIVDFLVLLRRGFDQSWQFVVIIQAVWIFLGLSDNVGEAIEAIFGITIPGSYWGIIAVIGVAACLILGLLLLLYGGTQRHSFLVNQRQNPAQALDYRSYQLILDRIDELEQEIQNSKKKEDTG